MMIIEFRFLNYSMSDQITFNLAAHGYNIAKYVPYGPIREVALFDS